MKKLTLIICLSFSVLCWWSATVYDHLDQGITGAPGEGQCSSCHTGNGSSSLLTVSGLPQYILSDTWYTVTVTVDGNNIEDVSGFQWTSVDANGNAMGILSNPGGGVELETFNGRNYAQHIDPNLLGLDGETVYTFDWLSPEVSQNTLVNFYAGGVVGNNDSEIGFDDFAEMEVLNRTLVPPLNVLSFQKEDVNCFGGNDGSITVIPEGGVAPITYEWSTGQTSNSISNLDAGEYSVTLMDDLGQTVSTNIIINQPSQINGAIFPTQEIACFGDENGILNAGASGGTSPFQYNWSTGASGHQVSQLDGGNYQLTITDDNGCDLVLDYFLAEPASLSLEPFNVASPDCFDENTGIIQVTAQGGTPPYQFDWSNGESGPSINSLGAGNYQVTLTDQNNCTEIQQFTLENPEAIESELETQNPFCDGENSGMVTITPGGGTPPYSISWADGSDLLERINLAAGNYSYTLTDANDCSISESFELIEPPVLEVELVEVTPSTQGNANGEIDVQLSGGTPPYTYSWIGGDLTEPLETEDISDLAAGSYELEVTDANGCSIQFGPVEVGMTIATTEPWWKDEITLPNPISSELIIYFSPTFAMSGKTENLEYKLINSQGQVLMQGEIPGGTRVYQAKIPVGVSGLVYLVVSNGERSGVFKVVVVP
ncbi:MAG: hypothetical protein GYB31_09080 [Bacteroidetes bacterium]|nr:hypothetical protein [Bacteroidota bacterium]